MGKNCWLKRTSLEIGLLLVLLVTVPVFIILTSTYLYLWLKNGDCIITTYKAVTEEKYPFMASILHYTYADSRNELEFLCAAVIITHTWIICSSACLNKNSANYRSFVIRVGSDYWSQGGSLHNIKRAIYADSNLKFTVVAIELENDLPKLPSIKPVSLPKMGFSEILGFAYMTTWRNVSGLPYSLRKKNLKIMSWPITIVQNNDCLEFVSDHNDTDIFCTIMDTEDCEYYLGSPVIKAQTLVGMQVAETCNFSPIYFIYDISTILFWIEEITRVKM